MAPLPERLTVTVDADAALAEIRALAEEYRQIVADLRELRGKPTDVQKLKELIGGVQATTADIAALRREVPRCVHDLATAAADKWVRLHAERDGIVLTQGSVVNLSYVIAEAIVQATAIPLRPSDPHGAMDRWRALEAEPAPMDGSTVLLGAFTGDGALVWACAAAWENQTLRGERGFGWFPLLPLIELREGYRDCSGRIGGDYPPTHWRPI